MALEDFKWYRQAVIAADEGAFYLPLNPYGLVSGEVRNGKGQPAPCLGKAAGDIETRLYGACYPFVSFEMRDHSRNAETGLSICRMNGEELLYCVDVFHGNHRDKNFFGLSVRKGGSILREETVEYESENTEVPLKYTIGFRIGAGMGEEAVPVFDMMVQEGGRMYCVASFRAPELSGIRNIRELPCFKTAEFKRLLPASDESSRALGGIVSMETYKPLAFADPRPVRYEDGSLYMEQGRIFFTISARMAEGACQQVVSLLPGTANFTTEAVWLFTYGDGKITSDVASSLLFDRRNQEFLLWNCAFSHGHVLAHCSTKTDVLHGIHLLKMETVPVMENSPETDFYGRFGDEDPDFYYDAGKGCWFMTVCRLSEEDNKYHFYKFTSKEAFRGYRFIEKTGGDHETGGTFTWVEGEHYFVCGADGGHASAYEIFNAEDFSHNKEADFDFPDGGFRGWGTVFEVPCGSFARKFWLTFDRQRAADYNWSYGNLYLFEGFPKE